MKPQLDPSSTVRAYISRAQRVPRLTREDEYALAVKVRDANDRGAAAALAEANLRYVVALAVSYRRYGLRLADLVSEGNVGLVTALKKFDPDRGNRFVTYASYWIRAYILDFVLKSWSMVGVGSGPLRSKVFFRLRRERAQIATQTSDPVEANELLAARFGTSPTKIAELAQRLDVRDLSLDAKAHDDGTATVVDTMASPLPSQEDELGHREEAQALSNCVRVAVDGLDARERYIVKVRIMADEPDAMSLAEIGRSLGVSRERARQLEARAKEKLKRTLGECWSGASPAGALVALDGHEVEAA